MGAYGSVGYRTSPGPNSYFSQQGAYGGGYGSSLAADERAIDVILGRLAAAEAASARLRAKLVAAAGGGSGSPSPGAAPAAAAHPGLEVIRKRCTGCHAPGGKGADSLVMVDEAGAWTPDLIKKRATLVDAVLSGKMPKNGELPDEELRAYLGFLYQGEEQ